MATTHYFLVQALNATGPETIVPVRLIYQPNNGNVEIALWVPATGEKFMAATTFSTRPQDHIRDLENGTVRYALAARAQAVATCNLIDATANQANHPLPFQGANYQTEGMRMDLIATKAALPIVLPAAWQPLPYLQQPIAAQTFANSGGNYQPAEYRIVGSCVYLRGLVSRGSDLGGQEAAIAQLPQGACPRHELLLATVGHPYQIAQVRVYPDGRITLYAGAASVDLIAQNTSLDGLNFFID